jgi:parallel beta-helix repeat protein
MTYKGAIRWEGATKSTVGSQVTNSVISSGRGMGIVIEGSANIRLIDNVIADHVQQGIWVKQGSQSITIDGNWVHHILAELKEPP